MRGEEAKADHVTQLQQAGRHVCFIADGINDSIAMRNAQVSISRRGAYLILATDTAQIILMEGNLNQLLHLFELADDFEENMRLNVISSVLSGVVCIGGVFLLHFGLWAGMAACYAGIAGGHAPCRP